MRTAFIIFILGLGVSFINYILFKFLNIYHVSRSLYYDSLININFLNFFKRISKKILIGKKFNQKSLFKKTLYSKYFLSLKKEIIFSRIKSGDINYFSRINNELIYLFSLRSFFLILTSFSPSIIVLNILNFFLSYRFNLSSILFIVYLNSLNYFRISYFFFNKIIIYYMLSNSMLYLLFSLYNNFSIFIFFFEISSFYSEHVFFFNFYDIFDKVIENFLYFLYPKYVIFNNFINFINLINLFLYL